MPPDSGYSRLKFLLCQHATDSVLGKKYFEIDGPLPNINRFDNSSSTWPTVAQAEATPVV